MSARDAEMLLGIRPMSGRYLRLHAVVLYAMRVRPWEYIPWLGDRWLRARIKRLWMTSPRKT